MRKHLLLAMLMAVLVSTSVPAAAGRKDAPPAEPTFVERLIMTILGRRDVMPEIKGTL